MDALPRLSNRQKIMLTVIDELSKNKLVSKTALVKSLFLIKYESSIESKVKLYDFFPYKYGPFSYQCYYDLGKLISCGLVTEKPLQLTTFGNKVISNSNESIESITLEIKEILHSLLKRFRKISEIIDYVYSKYPEYKVMSEYEREHSQKNTPGIYTIGYEGRSIDEFLRTLIQNHISTVFDVRRHAFSRNVFFRKTLLSNYLAKIGIEYVAMPQLGVERELRIKLKETRNYSEIFNLYRRKIEQNKQYVKKIIHKGEKHGVVIMCVEHDVNYCHRKEIANYIRRKGYPVRDL